MPELKSRDELKEIILDLNEFMGHGDADDPDRFRVSKKTPTDLLNEQLTDKLRELFASNFDGKGFAEVPVTVMSFAMEQGLGDEAPTPKSKKKAKAKPEPEPEPEEVEEPEEAEEEPEEDTEDAEAEEPEEAEEESEEDEEPEEPKLPAVKAKPVSMPSGIQLDLVAGANADDIAAAMLTLLNRIVQVGRVTIIIGEAEAPTKSSAADATSDVLQQIKLMKSRLRGNGDLGTRKAREAFIKKHDIKTPQKLVDCADKSLARTIIKWAEVHARGME